ncbi:hypothetical protein BH11MYX2_BH11MYX2_18260 [soil metagenome]
MSFAWSERVGMTVRFHRRQKSFEREVISPIVTS